MQEYLALSPNEPFQPVRLLYAIRRQSVYNALKRHPQVEYLPEKKCFVWRLSAKEAQVEGMDPAGFPPQGKGDAAYLGFKGEKEMWVSVHSYQRAHAAGQFVAKALGSKNARLVAAELSTRMYEADEQTKAWVEATDPLQEQVIEPDDYGRVMQEILSWQEQDSGTAVGITSFPEFVRWELPTGSRGLQSLQTVFSMLRLWSARQFTGEKDFALRDAAEELYQAYLEKMNPGE